MIKAAVLKRIKLSKQRDLRFLRDRPRGRSYIHQQKEREAEKTDERFSRIHKHIMSF